MGRIGRFCGPDLSHGPAVDDNRNSIPPFISEAADLEPYFSSLCSV